MQFKPALMKTGTADIKAAETAGKEQPFWRLGRMELLSRLNTSETGLPAAEAARRLLQQRRSERIAPAWRKELGSFLLQFRSPLVLLLLFAAILSLILAEYSDSMIVLAILLFTGLLGYFQERNAGKAIEKLREMVRITATVRRDGTESDIPAGDVVPGDIILLNAGDIVPADALLISSNDLHVNESALSGESFPVEKFAPETDIVPGRRLNAVFKGTTVINGTAVALAVRTTSGSELGMITASLKHSTTTTAFEKGMLHFGYFLMRITVIFTGAILILNVAFDKPFIDSILFALALTVGLTPELLPAILSITLASGAARLAKQNVIVKKPAAIECLGEINLLCSDKTGTITQGIVSLLRGEGTTKHNSQKLLTYAFLNAHFESGFSNPLDECLKRLPVDISGFSKTDEVPYDFIRKRLSVVVEAAGHHIMITKGAFDTVIDICEDCEDEEGTKTALSAAEITALRNRYSELSAGGYRVIAVCYKDVTDDPVINREDESAMCFLGFLVFEDPMKEGIASSVTALERNGVSLKIITGDNRFVAASVAAKLGLDTNSILSGADIDAIAPGALHRRVISTDVFAEVLPAQKERIVRAFQRAGYTVAYLGDGINDANALKAADVGISVNTAVDIARETADIVLLDQGIQVILEGIREGRKTFANTIKYVYLTTSANFGNMLSMAVASLMLPFLPLLPVQILFNNFLSDLPAVAISSDNVDGSAQSSPVSWNLKSIRRYMIAFGLQSSFFDFTTFAVLFYYFQSTTAQFRTAWFCESLLTELIIILVIRTRLPMYRSRPSLLLLVSIVVLTLLCFSLPYLPFAASLQLYPLPFTLVFTVALIAVVYGITAEMLKRLLVKRGLI